MSDRIPILSTRRGIVSALLLGLSVLLTNVAQADALFARIDPNRVAHRLHLEGRHAEAAEIFTDPAWKGIALYRSGQWWRAAEAFLRADDPVSIYNLGNCYARLGHPALALEAYARALALRPEFDDAKHNAELMRELLAAKQEDASGGARDPDEAIDRIERDEPETPPPSAAGGDGADDEGGRNPGEAGAARDAQAPDASGDGGRDEDDGEPADLDPERNDGGPADARAGRASSEPDAGDAAGTAEADAGGSSADAAGIRAELEAAQATEQWLNRIEHDPQRYLEKRIALELRRRSAAGRQAPAGGSGW